MTGRRVDELVARTLVFTTPFGKKFIPLDAVTTRVYVNPPKTAPSTDEVWPLLDLLEQIIEIDKRTYKSHPDQCFGLETRIAHWLTKDEASVPLENPRQVMLRPASEPIIYSYWNRFLLWDLDDGCIKDMARCLCAQDITYRQGLSATHPSRLGLSVIYPPASESNNWLSLVPQVPTETSRIDALKLAFMTMAIFVLHHPLVDGNGRVGRAIFQGVLGRTCGLSCPMLAIAPFAIANKREVIGGWMELGRSGGWARLVDAYRKIFCERIKYHDDEDF